MARGLKRLCPPILLSSKEEGGRQWVQCGRGEQRIGWSKICSSDKGTRTLLTCRKLLLFSQAPFPSPLDVQSTYLQKLFQTAGSPVKTQDSQVQDDGWLHCLCSASETGRFRSLRGASKSQWQPNLHQYQGEDEVTESLVHIHKLCAVTLNSSNCLKRTMKNQNHPIQRVVYLFVFFDSICKVLMFVFDLFCVITSFLRRGEQDTKAPHGR